jgi:Sulfotransferase domain
MKTIEKVDQQPDKAPTLQAGSSRDRLIEQAKVRARALQHTTLQTYRGLTSQWRLLPDFIIIGAQRSGTSSLYFYLTEHPGIVSAYYKEPHFFDDFYTRGLDWYRAQFPMAAHKYYIETIRKHRFLTGEASPYYLFHPHVPKRVAQVLPHVKLIALLRNPIDRAYSQHWLEVKGKYETLSFREATMCEHERTAEELEKLLKDENYHSFEHRRYTYLSRGIYVDQLQHWMNFFPREQFLVLRSEDMYTRPAEVVHETLEFLGVPGKEININREFKSYKVPSKKGYRNKDQTPKMDPELRAYLVDYFRPHNARLKEFLGRDFDWDK